MSRRSFRATKDQYDELPNDKTKLTKIMVAKNRHLKKMRKILDEAESDAIENDMISDPNELTKLLGQLVDRDKRLDREVSDMPKKIGRVEANGKRKSRRSTRVSCSFMSGSCMIRSWKSRRSAEET